MKFNKDKTLVITGAGISVESGIQPFRGGNGIWNENPMEMATNKKFMSQPETFLYWYYKRFASCKDAQPNEAHRLLAASGVRLVTQNIDALHVKAGHPENSLVQIHGNIFFKRKLDCKNRQGLVPADWESVRDGEEKKDLMRLFEIRNGRVESNSYRPHILLFDEIYSELYEFEVALEWIQLAETLVFIGTSNSVGITSIALDLAIEHGRRIVVVDPNPAPSLLNVGAEVFKMTAVEYCREVFSN